MLLDSLGTRGIFILCVGACLFACGSEGGAAHDGGGPDAWLDGSQDDASILDGATRGDGGGLPTQLRGPVVQVAGGTGHTCARLATGQVACWGRNTFGQLGDGTRESRDRPVLVRGLTDVVDISAGAGLSCARLRDQSIRCWGANGSGQLGDGTVEAKLEPAAVLTIDDAQALAVGGSHACVLRLDATVWCWGENGDGQLGDMSAIDRGEPRPVLGDASDMLLLAAGGSHVCGAKADSVWCWGRCAESQCANGGSGPPFGTPWHVPGMGSVKLLALGGSHTCALEDSGKAWCWGRSDSGQVGNGRTVSKESTRAEVNGLNDGISLALGGNHSCAIRSNKSVWCWGLNSSRQLGDGSTAFNSSVMVAVAGLLPPVKALGLGGKHSCAISETGALYCWGANEHGQLGDGTTEQRAAPTLVIDAS